MARDDSRTPRDPEQKSSGNGMRRDARGAAALLRRGHSGYGIESIRPHLRAHLEERKLWRQEFPPHPEDDEPRD